MVVTFDNLTMNVAYHAYSIDGKTGENPAAVAPVP